MGSTELEEVTLYVKAGVNATRLGACPFCHRVHMMMFIKAQNNLLKFKVVASNPAKIPPELKDMGLTHLPAIIHGSEGFDALDEIITYIDESFPGGGLGYLNSDADLVTKDFFSRFCFYIKDVNEDPTKLTAALEKINHYLEKTFAPSCKNTPLSQTALNEKQYICSDHLTHIDCETMPKLQHLRLAVKAIKNYDIPSNLRGLWRYLHTAYTEPAFTQSCPCDQEIALHWHDRPETPKLSAKAHSSLGKEKPKWSYDIPVHADLVQIV